MTRSRPSSPSGERGAVWMRIKGLTDEDLVNYKLPSMFIITNSCTFKCDLENGESCCQNSSLAKQKSAVVDDDVIIKRYLQNPITKAIVFGGLEPFDQYQELYEFIARLRIDFACNDDVVIYTGYRYNEIEGELAMLMLFDNIVVKFGRYRPNIKPRFDEVLGVTLASENQYALRIS